MTPGATPGRLAMLPGSSAFLELDGVLGPLETYLLPCKNLLVIPVSKKKEKLVFLLRCLFVFGVNGYGFRFHEVRAH